MKKKTRFQTFLAILSVLLSFLSHAQQYNESPEFLKANGIWWFGVTCGLDFNTRNPFTFRSGMTSMQGVVAVSSAQTGRFLFAAGGSFCRDINQSVMPNGNGLLGDGDGSCAQGKCAVPMLDSAGKYYLFSLESFGSPPTITRSGKLYYSVVDTSLNFGLGDIDPSRKNIFIDSGFTEGMIAIPGDNCDVWLLLHKRHSDSFIAYHITREGINLNPVISRAGAVLSGPGAYVSGEMAVSPDRSMVVATSNRPSPSNPQMPGAVICKFDPSTGRVSDGLLLTNTHFTFSSCFSPDNTKLYLTALNAVGPGADLLQYDVSNYTQTAIATSQTSVMPYAGYTSYYGSLKLYNDTIYINSKTYGGTSLDRINSPDLQGIQCDYDTAAVALFRQGYTQATLPNAIPFPKVDSFFFVKLDTLICDTAFNLTLEAEAAYAHYLWDDGSHTSSRNISDTGIYWVISRRLCEVRVDTFIIRKSEPIQVDLGGDTTVCKATTQHLLLDAPDWKGAAYLWQDGSTDRQYLVSESGRFWVKVSKAGCHATDTIDVKIIDLYQHLGSDTVLCAESQHPLVLNANVPPGASALWSDGSGGSELTVHEAGTYWVTVNQEDCSGTDTIIITKEICNCIIMVPTAFSPNGDMLNDRFLPAIQEGCPVRKYKINIYNRYGQRVYSSTDISQGWDGNYKGQPADMGNYMYEIFFVGGIKGKEFYQKGDLILIR